MNKVALDSDSIDEDLNCGINSVASPSADNLNGENESYKNVLLDSQRFDVDFDEINDHNLGCNDQRFESTYLDSEPSDINLHETNDANSDERNENNFSDSKQFYCKDDGSRSSILYESNNEDSIIVCNELDQSDESSIENEMENENNDEEEDFSLMIDSMLEENIDVEAIKSCKTLKKKRKINKSNKKAEGNKAKFETKHKFTLISN